MRVAQEANGAKIASGEVEKVVGSIVNKRSTAVMEEKVEGVENLLQWTIKMHDITEILEHKRDFIDRGPLGGGNLLWASSIQNNSSMISLASTLSYILSLI